MGEKPSFYHDFFNGSKPFSLRFFAYYNSLNISPPKSADFLDKHKIASKNATVIKENDTAWPPPQLALRRPLHA